ncbi:MAG: class I SAM-dependent methyltransferase, partial [Thermoguttaceae bacterium]
MSLSVSRKNATDAQTSGYGQEVSAFHNEISANVGHEEQDRLSSRKGSAFSKSSSSAFERWLCRCMLKTLGAPPVRLVLWDGEEISASREPSAARVFIGDRPTLRRLILDPEFHFGEAYSQGRLEVEGDLRDFLEIFYRTRLRCGAASHPLKRIWRRFLHARRSNSLADARENIHRHYDIGNDFYQLWLDPLMIYSCGYFAREDMTLAEAQLAKLDYVCRKLWLRPGESVVDIGGGWGGLAIHMARRYGVTVKAFNISRQQNEFARRRARAEGLDGRVEFIEDDYRNISGRYDALVSLGMLEH